MFKVVQIDSIRSVMAMATLAIFTSLGPPQAVAAPSPTETSKKAGPAQSEPPDVTVRSDEDVSQLRSPLPDRLGLGKVLAPTLGLAVPGVGQLVQGDERLGWSLFAFGVFGMSGTAAGAIGLSENQGSVDEGLFAATLGVGVAVWLTSYLIGVVEAQNVDNRVDDRLARARAALGVPSSLALTRF